MIGYYAHQHGSGHCNFAEIFSEVFRDEMVVFTSQTFEFSKNSKIFKLADENPDGSAFTGNQIEPPSYLHYSPVGQQSIKVRSLQLLKHIVELDIHFLIVDVSAEISALCRAASVPYAYVRLPGERNDSAHLEAYKGAVFLLAYFPRNFEMDSTPDWVKKKTIYLGFLSKKNHGCGTRELSHRIQQITVISGNGGNKNLQHFIPKLLERFEEAKIKLLGNYENQYSNSRLHYFGFIRQPEKEILGSDLIVANCGLNTVSELTQIPIPYIAIPEDRPFDEQKTIAKLLYRNKLAIDYETILNLSDQEILNYTKMIEHNQGKENLLRFKQLLFENNRALPRIPEFFEKQAQTKNYEFQG